MGFRRYRFLGYINRVRLLAIAATVLVFIPAPGADLQESQTAGSETSRVEIAAADSMQRKIDYLKRNATITPADPRPTIFSQTEINAYFAQRRVKMPDGVKSVVFNLSPGEVAAKTLVDFDELTANARSHNPLLAIFNGVHNVDAVARVVSSGNGVVSVSVQSVSLDGMEIPRMALDLFIQRFVNPKFPSVRLDGEYKLPVRINTVKVDRRTGTVTQK
jgi:hypothetical protein